MSLLSDLNNKIKALSTRVGTEVKSLWSGVNTAQSTATAAQTTANTANSTANTAKSTADTANSTANTALSTANEKVSKSGDTMTGLLNVPAGFRVMAQNSDLEGGELVLDAANTSLLHVRIDNYNNQCRWIFQQANGTVTNIGGISSSGVLNLPNGTAIWIA